MDKVLLSTGKDDWETPKDFYKKLDDEFHYFWMRFGKV